jgi:hypothetical protein
MTDIVVDWKPKTRWKSKYRISKKAVFFSPYIKKQKKKRKSNERLKVSYIDEIINNNISPVGNELMYLSSSFLGCERLGLPFQRFYFPSTNIKTWNKTKPILKYIFKN